MMASAVLLVKSVYVEAMQSAELKNNAVNYRKIQADPSIVLIYNPETKDGMFSSRLTAIQHYQDGYYLAYPQIRYAQSLAENNANLRKYGWPAWEGI